VARAWAASESARRIIESLTRTTGKRADDDVVRAPTALGAAAPRQSIDLEGCVLVCGACAVSRERGEERAHAYCEIFRAAQSSRAVCRTSWSKCVERCRRGGGNMQMAERTRTSFVKKKLMCHSLKICLAVRSRSRS
jgi:hypothetical protein